MRFLPYKNIFWNAITYELSLTRHEVSLEVYSFIDFLSNIGGLVSALSPLGFFLVSIFHYRGVYPFIMSDT